MNLLEEVKVRAQLLARNADLLQLHKSLVATGIVSEEDFWRARLHLVAAEAALLNQRAPPTSSLASTTATAQAQAEGGAKKVVLTAAIIKAILAERPAVAQAHADLVPTSLSEGQFWQAYFASRFALEHGINPPAEAANSPLEPYYQVESKTKTKNAKDGDTAQVDLFTNLVSTEADNPNAQGGFISGPQRTAASLELMRKFNQHSAAILQAANVQRSTETLRHAIEIVDLNEVTESEAGPALPQLSLPSTTITEEYDYGNLALEIERLPNSKIEFVQFPFAVLKEKLAPFECSPSAQAQEHGTLITPEMDGWRRKVSEILRHLYMALPVGSDSERLTKATRMLDMLRDLYDEYQRIDETDRRQLYPLLHSSTLKPIEHALSQREHFLSTGPKRPKLK